MKKVLLAIPVVLGLGAFIWWKSTSPATKPQPQPGATSSTTPSNVGHVTPAAWDDHSFDESRPNGGEATTAQEQDKGAGKTTYEGQLTEKFLKTSGIKKKFLSMAPMLKEQLEMMIADEMISEKERNELLEQFRRNFSAEKLLADYEQKLQERFSAEEIQELVEIYEHPEIQRFNQLNSELSDPEKLRDIQDELSDFMKDYDPSAISPEKKKMIEALDDAFNSSAQAIELTKSFLNVAGESNEELEKQMGQMVSGEVFKGFVFALRETPDQNISDLTQAATKNPNFKITNKIMGDVIKGPMSSFVGEMHKRAEAEAAKAKKSAHNP